MTKTFFPKFCVCRFKLKDAGENWLTKLEMCKNYNASLYMQTGRVTISNCFALFAGHNPSRCIINVCAKKHCAVINYYFVCSSKTINQQVWNTKYPLQDCTTNH